MSYIHKELLKKYKNEFTVVSEDKGRHKRQIASGDYRRKLRDDTIQQLTHQFEDILRLLNYET